MRVAVIGMGYVGLPLAVELGCHYSTTGFDLKASLIEAYGESLDPMGEVSSDAFKASKKLTFTTAIEELTGHDIYIIAVPTPVDEAKQPDLSPLRSASEIVGKVLGKGAIVVFESTVYPGVTEEFCAPILEQYSGLKWPQDFHVAYSPERINPGDKARTLTRIIKVVSADSPEVLAKVAALYGSIITAGVYQASSIKVAEAAKVIENTQRDLNIAFVNELAIIFDKMGIDTEEVLKAAETKWNFLPFRPGLVGGHCIGVDPYYLTSKAQSLGYLPEVILAGRRINDGMGKFIAEKTVKMMFARGLDNSAKVLVCGLTFKEDCPDLRNSQVLKILDELNAYGLEVLVHDPVAEPTQAKKCCGVELLNWDAIPAVDAVLLAVPHQQLLARGIDSILGKVSPNGVFIDVKSVFSPALFAETAVDYWRL